MDGSSGMMLPHELHGMVRWIFRWMDRCMDGWIEPTRQQLQNTDSVLCSAQISNVRFALSLL